VKTAFCHPEIINFASSLIPESALLLRAFKYSFPPKILFAHPHIFLWEDGAGRKRASLQPEQGFGNLEGLEKISDLTVPLHRLSDLRADGRKLLERAGRVCCGPASP